MGLPQECFQWWTLVLRIVNLQVTLPCGQLCSNTKFEDSVMKADTTELSQDRPKAGRVELSGSATPAV
jgi:hypothetical protein